MKYLVDFDHTLFDTSAFVEEVIADGREEILVTPAIWQWYDVRAFLYDDVLSWLASKAKEDVYILSAMTPELGPESCTFQREKIASGKFESLISDTILVVGLKGKAAREIASQFPASEPTVFIDDRLEQCLSVKEALPEAHCFLMLREGRSATPHAAIPMVTNLEMVDAIMKTRI